MRYTAAGGFAHDAEERVGVLITNLGTPDAPTAPALRRYLAEFLADPRVINAPRWVWLPVLHGWILRTRPRRSAEAYAAVWGEDGSPLLAIARRQAAALQHALDAAHPGEARVELAMRYGRPSIPRALERLRDAGARRVVVLPLYPQYSAATTGSTFDALARALARWRRVPALRFVDHYHDEPRYLDALAASVREHRERHGRGERLLLSFHGLPERHLLEGDPYHCECRKTARLVAERLGLGADEWAVAFQSRVGPARWLEPYTDVLLREWAGQGLRHVDVVCPGFSADCLETLEEIAMRARDDFVAAGGERLEYVPALNDRADHVAAIAGVVERAASGWWAPEGALADAAERGRRRERARALGAER